MKMFNLFLLFAAISLQCCTGQETPNYFPRLEENSQSFGLWPLFTPLMNVAPECKTASIKYANQVLDEGSQFIFNLTNGGGWKAGPATKMIDSTGRLPKEGMLTDYFPIVGQDACGILAAFIPIIDCTNPIFQSFEIKLPIGYAFDPGSPLSCLDADGKYCLAIWSQVAMEKSDKKSFDKMFGSTGGKLALEYLYQNPIVRGVLAENMEFIESLQSLNLLEGGKNSSERDEAVTTNPIIDDAVKQLVKLFITIWAGAQQPLGFGQCVPIECQYSDIGANLNAFYEVENFNAFDTDPTVSNERYYCWDNDSELEWTSLDTFISIVFITLALLLAMGTVMDILQQIFTPQNKKHQQQSFGNQILLSFSMYTNFKKIISTEEGGRDTLSCLHGMRFLSMSWVILGHSFIFSLYSLSVNNASSFTLKAYTGEFGFAFQAILQATPSVDSFFLFSGLLVSYLLLKELDKCNGKFKLVMFYVHRYIRLTIPLAFITAFFILCLPAVARFMGPKAYATALSQKDSCTEWGWANLVYLNNFFARGNDCIGVTWYTCDDMIFFWISPLVIYPMWSNGLTGGLIWWTMWLFGATFPSIYETWTFRLGIDGNPLPNSDLNFVNGYGALPDFYREPWTRFQPYLVGILLGYILHKTKNMKFKMSSAINVIGWQVAFLSAFAVVYGPYSQVERYPLTNIEYTLYNGFQRFAWSSALSWVIFSCSRGYGGMINDFLSWKFFLPLSRISFMTYLIHTFMIFIVNGHFGGFAVDGSLTLMTGLYLSHLIIAMALAVLLTLAFESPFIRLEKLLIGAMLHSPPQEKKKPV